MLKMAAEEEAQEARLRVRGALGGLESWLQHR